MRRFSALSAAIAIALLIHIDAPSARQRNADQNNAKRLVTEGKLEAGVPPCALCHAKSGKGSAVYAFGNLTGLSEQYIAKQLRDYRSGDREHLAMERIASGLSDDDIAALAAYYAKAKVVDGKHYRAPKGPWLGKTLATQGISDRGLPACVSCHAQSGQPGHSDIPNIYGQHARYIVNQLEAWKSNQRHNDPGGVMASIARKLTHEEMMAVAAYFANQPRFGH